MSGRRAPGRADRARRLPTGVGRDFSPEAAASLNLSGLRGAASAARTRVRRSRGSRRRPRGRPRPRRCAPRVLGEVGPPVGGVALRLAAALHAPHPANLLPSTPGANRRLTAKSDALVHPPRGRTVGLRGRSSPAWPADRRRDPWRLAAASETFRQRRPPLGRVDAVRVALQDVSLSWQRERGERCR